MTAVKSLYQEIGEIDLRYDVYLKFCHFFGKDDWID